MIKKYLKLFEESLFKVQQYTKFSNTQWQFFLDSYEKIFRKIDKEVFVWYFQKNNSFNILQKNNEFIGIYGLIEIVINYNSQNINSFLCHNVGIKKEYSGKGLFQFLAEKSLIRNCNENNLILGFPNKASFKGHIRVGWEQISNMRFLKFDNLFSNVELSTIYKFENVERFDHRLESAMTNFRDNFSVSLVKDYKYLNWRIAKPNNSYKCFLIKEEESIQGYLILKEYQYENETRLHLVDFNFKDEHVLNEIIKFSIKYFQNGKYEFINTWSVENSIYENIFLKNNFIIQTDFPSYPVILFQKSNVFYFNKIDKSKIFFTLFDNDVF